MGTSEYNNFLSEDYIQNFVPLFVLSCNKVFVYADEAALDFLGADNFSALQGKSFDNFAPEYQDDGQKSYDKINYFFKKALNSKPVKFKLKLTSLNSQTLYCELKIVVSKNDFFTVLIKDITEEKQTEIRLRNHIRRIESAIEIGHDLVWSFDVKQRNFFFFPSIYKYMGFDSIESSISVDNLKEYCSKTEFEHLEKSFESLINGEQSDFTSEFILYGNNRHDWFRLSGMIEKRDSYGNATVISGTMSNVSSFKHSESLLRKQNEETELINKRLQELNNQLRENDQALKLGETYYRTLFDNACTAIWVHYLDGTMITVNPFTLSLLGLESADQIVGHNLEEFFYPGYPGYDKQAVLDEIHSLSGKGFSSLKERCMLKSDGSRVWTKRYLNLVKINDTDVIMTMVQDITQEKNIEASLTVSKINYNNLFENASNAIWIHETEGTVLEVNDLTLKYFGLQSKFQIIGKNIAEFFYPGFPYDEQGIRLNLEKAENSGGVTDSREWCLKKSDGSPVWVERFLRLFYLNGREVIMCFANDITHRKQIEENLKTTEINYRTLFDNSCFGIWVHSPQGEIFEINEVLLKFLGAESKEEILGKKVQQFLYHTHPYNNRNIEAALNADESVADPTPAVEWCFQTVDGRPVWGMRHLRSVIIAGRKMIMSIIRDINEKKQMEQSLKISEYKYQTIFDKSAFGILVFDLKGNIIDANDVFVSFLGYQSKSEIINHHLDDFVEEPFKFYEKAINETYEKTITKESLSLRHERSFKRKDGVITWGQCYLSFVNFGNSCSVLAFVEDVDLIKQITNKLKSTQVNYQTVFDNACSGIVLYTSSCDIYSVNDTFAQILGYDSKDDLTDKKLYDLFSPRYKSNKDDYKKVSDFFINIIESGNGKEWYFLRKDGSEVIVITYVTTIKMYNQDLYMCFVNDLTLQKEAEYKAKIVSERFKNALIATNDGIWECDSLTHEEYISQQCYNILGYTGQESPKKFFATKRFKEHGIDYSSEQFLEEVLQKGSHSYEFSIPNSDGSKKFILIRGKLVESGADKEKHVVGTLSDITELKQNELHLAHQNAMLNAIIESTPLGIYIVDSDRNVLYANSMMKEICGDDCKDSDGKMLLANSKLVWNNSQGVIPPEQYPVPLALEGKITVLDGVDIIHRDGTHVSAYIKAAPVYDKNGNLIAAVCALLDITQRIQAQRLVFEQQDALESKNEEYLSLNEELRQTNNELIYANQKAEEADKLKASFLANLSHEIRTPMNGILGFAELLKDENLENSERAMYVDIIRRSSNQLLGIINDIVEISKIDTGQTTINLCEVNIFDVITDLEKIFNLQYASRSEIHLFCSVDDICRNLYIKSDEVKLRQVFTNLINNAFKYTQKGYVKISLRYEDNCLIFDCKDTGCGIKAENLGIIFNRFVRIDNGDSFARGTGLGLSIASAYAKLLGGTINVKSEFGSGSTFSVKLPLDYFKGTTYTN